MRHTLYPKPIEVSISFVANTLKRPQNKEGGGELKRTNHHYQKSTITPILLIHSFWLKRAADIIFQLVFWLVFSITISTTVDNLLE